MALHQAGKPDQAEALLRRVLHGGAPSDVRAWGVMGSVLASQGKHEQARHYLERAIAAGHETAALRSNLGNILLLAGHAADARRHFERALEIDAEFAAGWLGLAPALHALGDGEGSVRAARRSLELAPGTSSAILNLASALVGMGHIDEALALARGGIDADPGNIRLITNYLMALHYSWGRSPAEVLAEHVRLGARFGSATSGGRAPGATPGRDDHPERRLRVGYLSSDLRNHVVAVFVRGMLAARNRDQFGAIAYSVGARDAVAAKLQPLFDEWRECASATDDELERRIRADRIDILVDLNGHTEGSRVALLSRRVAPVQVTCVGYPDITGVPNVDWRLVDEVTDPPALELMPVGTERLYRVPGCFLCYAPPGDAPEVEPVPPCVRGGAGAAGVTFGSFNAAPKIGPELLNVWGGLLARVPGSRLLLKNRALASAMRRDEVMRAIASGMGAAAGECSRRVELIAWSAGFAEHLAEYRRVDIGLDSMPYNGTTTTCEALWMGVPVVAMTGDMHVSRVGASLLRAAGLEELVARDLEGYVSLAVALAGDPARLGGLRASLRERVRASRLCDVTAHARAIEGAYRAMWSEWVARGARGASGAGGATSR